MNETRSVVVREIPHPPEKVWRALAQPHLIEEWPMKNDFNAVVGHRFNLRGDWGGVLDREVLAVEPNRTLSYTWNFAHDDAAYNLRSVGAAHDGPDSAQAAIADWRLKASNRSLRVVRGSATRAAASTFDAPSQ